MLKNIALGIALLTTMWFVPVAAQSEAPIIRTQLGVRFEVPAGWEWDKFDGNSVTIQHLATKSGEKGRESSPNVFGVNVLKSSTENFDPAGWKRIDRNERRTFPNSATARWQAGISNLGDYVFKGEMTIGSRVLWVYRFDAGSTPRFDVSVVEAAFLRVAETLRSVPESAVIFHPSLRIAVDDSKSKVWFNSVTGRNIAFIHFANGAIKNSNANIYAYPSSEVFPDTGKALADITSHFEKNNNLKIGEVRRTDVPGGEVLWTEQLGSRWPFLAAVRRDGRYFFVSMFAGTSVTSASDAAAVREDFLAVAKSVRAWDGN